MYFKPTFGHTIFFHVLFSSHHYPSNFGHSMYTRIYSLYLWLCRLIFLTRLTTFYYFSSSSNFLLGNPASTFKICFIFTATSGGKLPWGQFHPFLGCWVRNTAKSEFLSIISRSLPFVVDLQIKKSRLIGNQRNFFWVFLDFLYIIGIICLHDDKYNKKGP